MRLTKCDTETLKWADAVGKMASTCLTESCHKPSICKKKKKKKYSICKCSKVKHSKTRYAYVK